MAARWPELRRHRQRRVPRRLLGTGSPSYTAAERPPAQQGRQDLRGRDRFVRYQAESAKGHGVAFANLDNDGDRRLSSRAGRRRDAWRRARVSVCSRTPGTATTGWAWSLVGVKTIGACAERICTVTVENTPGGTRSIYRTVNSGGTFGASPLARQGAWISWTSRCSGRSATRASTLPTLRRIRSSRFGSRIA